MRDILKNPAPQIGDVVNNPGSLFDGATVVSVYTRAQAIADGVLIDATTERFADVTAQHCPRVHVAMTAAVFGIIKRAVENTKHCNDWLGVWHDVMWMSHARQIKGDFQRTFGVIIVGAGRQRNYTLKLVSHCDELGRPCITIMLPEEG